MKGQEIREKFLHFFQTRNHHLVKSSPLVLTNDPTLLFVNAGMNQFKDIFLGLEERDYKRATSVQKCMRAGGKHNDLDEIGKTTRHHTFFEMLGNFSFGDYFKEKTIKLAWELITKEFQLPIERLWFSIYEDDDESFELWLKVGASPDRILRFGAEENFWEMGETGPCGPCSEIHYYLGDDLSNNRPEFVNGEGGETVEIWNLVFMQYNRDKSGNLTPLPKPCADTGMGLERIATVLQGVHSNFETDLLRPIIDFISDLANKDYVYESEEGFSMRVIADHARAAVFLITDGIFPGNDGRAYVLRKIMRRAIWQGQRLGLETPFLNKVTGFVADFMSLPYPELIETKKTIERVVVTEEKLFSSTLTTGMRKLEEIMEKSDGARISGLDAFMLYDTYGLREDLIEYIAVQNDYTVDWSEFQAEFERQRERARDSWKGGSTRQIKEIYQLLAERVSSEFTGYNQTEIRNAKILAIFVEDEERETLKAGESGQIILDRTPFYAESGGQVGDTGVIESDTARALVNDTVSPASGLIVHKVKVELGEFEVGKTITATADFERREQIKANHTGTHLLHAALREVLGPHVKQAGSLVAPDRLRFDFTHFAPLTPEEVAEIERLVNTQILKNIPLSVEMMSLDEAINTGAMALFGEKYMDKVRVVSVPGFSRELCGGTHAKATGDIGLFKFISDSSIASGVRRLEALTGMGAFKRFQSVEKTLGTVAQRFRTTYEDVPQQVGRMQEQLKIYQREIESLKLKLASSAGLDDDANVRQVEDITVLTRQVEGLDAPGRRILADNLMNKTKAGVVIVGQASDEQASLLVRISNNLVKTLHAGNIVKELAKHIDGKGGGRPDLAEAGGRAVNGLQPALEASYDIIRRMIISTQKE